MKRTLILMVMLSSMVAAALPLIAEGAQEQAEPYGWNNTARQPGQYTQPEQIELSGAVEFTAGHTRLNAAGGEVYELMYPMYLADSLQIEDGQLIDVEGFLIPGPRWSAADAGADEEQYLRLMKVIIDGEEYELSFGPAAGRFAGRSPGQMGGKSAGRYDNRPGMMGSRRY